MFDVPRPWMFAAGVVCCAIAASLLPVAARTSLAMQRSHALLTQRLSQDPPAVETPEPGMRDPFVPDDAPLRDAAPLIVRAVIAGADPRALVEDDGRMRIVQVGDAAGGSHVAAITRDAITLASGVTLRIEPKP